MLSRRSLMTVAACSAVPLASPTIARNTRARTLRLVPSTNLVSLDPVFSTALVAVQRGYHVFDTLYGVDAAMRPRPQMPEGVEAGGDGRTWTISSWRAGTGRRATRSARCSAAEAAPMI